MSTEPSYAAVTFTADSLLRHESFVRAVVRGLVADESAVDDVVQETWLAALRRGPRSPGAVRGWLAAVARNMARGSTRADARRDRREREAARPEALDAVDLTYERLSAERNVVDCILGLDEPYRTVVVLRYYHDLKPTAIAARLGAKPATVRTQLVRAHARLRDELDERHGPERSRALLLAILRVARGSARATPKLSLLAGGALAVVAAAVLAYLPIERRGPESSVRPIEDAPQGAASQDALAAVATDAVESPVPSGEDEVAARTPLAPVVDEAALGTLDLEVVWWDGTEAANVDVRLLPATTLDALRGFAWRRSNDRGRIHVERITAGPVAVVIERAGMGGTQRVDVIGGIRNTATVTIPAGADVRGVVLDAMGRPLAGASLWCFPDPPVGNAFRVGRTSADGSFFLRSLAHEAELAATSEAHGSSRMLALADAPQDENGVRDVELRLEGESHDVRGTVKDTHGSAIEGALVHVLCASELNEGRLPGFTVATDAEGRFAFSGRPAHSLVTIAPGFALATTRVAMTSASGSSTEVDVVLDPGFTLTGRVVLADGAPARDARVQIDLDFLCRFYRLATSTDAEGNYALENVPAGRAKARASVFRGGVRVESNGELSGFVGERVTWDVAFGTGPPIRGRAIDDTGAPLAGWAIELSSRHGVYRDARTDAEGRFEFTGLLEGEYDVRLFAPEDDRNLPRVRLARIRPSAEELELVAGAGTDPSAFVVGRLVDAAGAPFEPEQAWARRTDGLGSRAPVWEEDGRFRVGPLSPGDYELAISPADGLPTFTVPGIRVGAGETHDAGTIALPRTGTAELFVHLGDGTPLAEGSMAFLVDDGRAYHPLTPIELGATEFDGEGSAFRSAPLFAGTYELVVLAGNAAAPRGQTIEVLADTTSRATFEVVAGRRVALRFAVPDGERLPRSVDLRVTDALGTVVCEMDARTQSGPGGQEFLIHRSSMPVGEHAYDVTSAEGWSASGRFVIEEGPEPIVGVEIALER